MSPLAVLTKLAAMLCNVPAVQFVFAKFAALLRNNESGEASGVITSTVDQHAAVLQPSSDHAIAVPETNDQSEREKLIRRRWTVMFGSCAASTGAAACSIEASGSALLPKAEHKIRNAAVSALFNPRPLRIP
jgi:hypothetical protein